MVYCKKVSGGIFIQPIQRIIWGSSLSQSSPKFVLSPFLDSFIDEMCLRSLFTQKYYQYIITMSFCLMIVERQGYYYSFTQMIFIHLTISM